MCKVAFWLTVVVLLLGCKPETPPPSSSASLATAKSAVWVPTATPIDKQGVAGLLRSAPSPGESVEIDAYFSGATTVPHLGGFPPPPDQIACPNDYETALTDRPFLAYLRVLNSIEGNPLPDNVPWLIAVTSDMLKPGVWQLPQTPPQQWLGSQP